MDLSEPDYGCKKHSNHQENQGVCPSCLRERLSHLTSVSHEKTSPPYVYPADSNSASPARHQNLSKRNSFRVMGIMGMSSVKAGTTSNGLNKSKSIAFVPRNSDEEARSGKRNKGFWSKWVHLHFKEKKDVLTHSTSMRLMVGKV
ncbi:hypothetical protein HRI_003611800 [Hibiscus trionum]|uniref:Uncharacterized protein n=1 Tax=Hibiscus trionum TaxID=183268 RepID=A0A9W7MIV3_HIBTR|nr:hypothetical protein HRI_003611800 [Hibiscus trionum]